MKNKYLRVELVTKRTQRAKELARKEKEEVAVKRWREEFLKLYLNQDK